MSAREMVDSGVEWIGVIPKGWDIVRLRSLALIETGSMNTDDREDNGIYPLYVRSKTIEKSNKYTHDTSAILVPGEGLIGEIFHLATGKHAVHQRVYSIQPYKGNFIKYIRYFMIAGFGTWAKQNSNTVTVESLRRPTFLNFILSLPPLSEQQSIANFLDHHVNLIDCELSLIDKKMELLGEKREALIFECVTGKRTVVPRSSLTDTANVVGHGDWLAVPTENDNLMDSGVDWIGAIPKGWTTNRLSNIFSSWKRGVTPTYDEESNFFILNQSCLSKYKINQNKAKKCVPLIGQRGLFAPGDILLASTGGGIMGKCAFSLQSGYVDTHITIIKPKKQSLNLSKIIFYWMSTQFTWMQQFGKGSTNQIEFQARPFMETVFPVCSFEEQLNISNFLDYETSFIDKEISLLTRKKDLLAEKRKSLIFEAVTGKIDCRSWIV